MIKELTTQLVTIHGCFRISFVRVWLQVRDSDVEVNPDPIEVLLALSLVKDKGPPNPCAANFIVLVYLDLPSKSSYFRDSTFQYSTADGIRFAFAVKQVVLRKSVQ